MPDECVAVIDLETTGLFPGGVDRVVEIAIVIMSPDGTVHDVYETLVNPGRDMGPTHIHRISASDVNDAPSFAEVAGDVLGILMHADILAGHNVRFDMRFLISEFMRLGIALPDIPILCTYQLTGTNLERCREEYGIVVDGPAHRAISDARASGVLVSIFSADDSALIESRRIGAVTWPELEPLNTPRVSRELAEQAQNAPPAFLQRITNNLHHDTEENDPDVIEYLRLMDRVLEDRIIDESEQDALADAATALNLTLQCLMNVHAQYLGDLAVLALADGVVTESEQRDLIHVAKLLGLDVSAVDNALNSAERILASASLSSPRIRSGNELSGKRVCFTGTLQSTVAGVQIGKTAAASLAKKAGLLPATSVTKKLDLLVVADPHTQSGKAKKARQYGIRIMHESVFWQTIGVEVT